MDTPLSNYKRAINLGLKVVSNFEKLDPMLISYYERHLNEIPKALARGFIIEEENFIVRVDRSKEINYPDFVKKILHPEMENIGPESYILKPGELLYYLIENSLVEDTEHNGIRTYNFLKEKGLLENCLGFEDLLAMKEKDISIIHGLFSFGDHKSIIGFRSVAEYKDTQLIAPYLSVKVDEIKVEWTYLKYFIDPNTPVYHF